MGFKVMVYCRNTNSIRSFAQDRAVICGRGRGNHCRCPKELLNRPKYVHIMLTFTWHLLSLSLSLLELQFYDSDDVRCTIGLSCHTSSRLSVPHQTATIFWGSKLVIISVYFQVVLL